MRVPQALLLFAILALMAFAGCLDRDDRGDGGDQGGAGIIAPPTQPGLTEATFAAGQFIATAFAARDGAAIHVDIQLPEGDGPFPTIVEYTPYVMLGTDNVNGAQRERPEVFGEPSADFWVARGYATATAHVRGTGESEGCLTIGAPIEGSDGYDLVEWIAAQPWSSGKVALMGTSYVGTTPLETAVWQPPHLTTIVPISPVTEWYLYYFENGLHRNNADPPPGSSNSDPLLWAALGIVPGPRTGATGGLEDVRCQVEYGQQDVLNDDYNAYWHDRDHHAKAGDITVPVLFAHGWEDGNVAPTGIETLWENITVEKRLWVQQHGHGVPGGKTAYHEYVHRWLDHYLLGRDNGVLLLPQVIIEDNLARYRSEPAWPPLDQAWQRLNISAGRLGSDDGGPAQQTLADTGAPPQAEGVDLRSFTTSRFEAAVHIAGTPRLHLRASSNLPTGQLAVNLYDDAPDGGASVLVSRGFLDLRHRDSLDSGQDLTPGTFYDIAWDLHPNDHVVASGHALRLAIAANDDYVRQGNLRPTLTLSVGDGMCWLDLPVIDDGVRAFADQPVAPWVVPDSD